MKAETIHDHFGSDWTDFYATLVDIPSSHNGSAKIRSPLRDDDNDPSFHITLTGEHAGRWRDWGTKEHGDAIDLYMRIKGISSFAEAVVAIAADYGIDGGTARRIRTLAERKITPETARAFRIVETSGDPVRISFPVYSRDGQTTQKVHKGPQTKGAEAQLYPWKALKHDEVFLVNGEPSVWRSWQDGHCNVLCGTGGEGHFKEEWVALFQGKTVSVVFDNDDVGRNASEKVARMLEDVAKEVRVVEWPADFEPKGDVEDWLNSGRTLGDLPLVPWIGDRVETPSLEESESSRQSQADKLVSLALGTVDDLFHDQTSTSYARISVNGHRETRR